VESLRVEVEESRCVIVFGGAQVPTVRNAGIMCTDTVRGAARYSRFHKWE
jgi:molybdopterin biosynthesis enzyme